jgi:hypothetical protein
MIKKIIKYLDIVDGLEIELERNIYFLFSLKSIRLYESHKNKNFFEDYSNVWKIMVEKFKIMNPEDIKNISFEQQIEFSQVLFDPSINNFLIDVTPCLYCKISDNKFYQDEITFEEAENSMWFMEVINFEFFMDIFQEMTKNQNKIAGEKSKSLKKNESVQN